MTTGPGGVRAALDQAMDGAAQTAGVVQAGLFDADLTDDETGALDVPSPLSAALGTGRARRGRPPGAKNRRTEAVTAWLLSQHRHPVSVMMEAYSMTPAQLAERIGMKKGDGGAFDNGDLLDIFKLQVRMAEAVAPYVAQKLPQAVQLEGGANLSISFGGVTLGGAGSGVSVPARGGSGEILTGDGMAVRLGQVGRAKSDGDPND